MAIFYKGFVYETDVSGRLMIEGVVRPFDAAARDADSEARRYIDMELLPGRDEIQAKHLGILNKGGVAEWNRWRSEHPEVRPTLACAKPADFHSTELRGCDFSYTNLCQAQLPTGIHLEGASFHQAILAKANLSKAHLEGANFCRTDLYETDLTDAWLTNANLQGVQLAKTKLAGAHLSGCTVYGLSAWDLRDVPADAHGLRIRYTPAIEHLSDAVNHSRVSEGEVELEVKELEVDGLDLASFMYLTLNNRNISRIIDAASQKWVLILGRFTEGKEILEAIEGAMKEWGFIPIIFDFPPPDSRDLIETLLLIAGLSAFVVVEMTNPRSTPLEVMAIVPNYAVPVLPIVRGEATEPAMVGGLRKFRWVQKPIRYREEKDLIPQLCAWVESFRNSI